MCGSSVQMWAWNKVALLQKVLKETPPERAPWILYMQPDTIIDDIAFTFPFEMYQDKHWVSVGQAESVLNGWASGESTIVGILEAIACDTCHAIPHQNPPFLWSHSASFTSDIKDWKPQSESGRCALRHWGFVACRH